MGCTVILGSAEEAGIVNLTQVIHQVGDELLRRQAASDPEIRGAR